MDKAQWPALKERFAEIFQTKTRDEWCEIMEDTDVCFAPVLVDGRGARSTRTTSHRGTFVERRRRRRSRRRRRASAARPARSQRPPAHAGQHTDEVLADWGFDAATRIAEAARRRGAIA